MIERVVLVKLTEEFAEGAKRLEVATYSLEALSKVAGVREVSAASPADERSGKDWDLYLNVRFETLDDVRRYLADPQHRAYVDDYLRPRIEVIKAWNFERV